MKHCIPPMHGKTGFPFPFTRIHRFSANEKDFSLALEMTVRGSGILASFPTPRGKALMRRHRSPSFLWKEVPRRGGGWLTERNKKECVRSIFSYRLPRRSQKSFVCCHGSKQILLLLSEIKKEHCDALFYLPCLSKALVQTRKIVPLGIFRRALILIPAPQAQG